MKTQIISIFLCLVFFFSCKDDEPTVVYGEDEIEYNTDSPEWFPGNPSMSLHYSEFDIYENIIQTVIEKEGVKRHEIKITEMKLKSGILIPKNLSEEDFSKIESGDFVIVEKLGSGMSSIRNDIVIGTVDLTNSSNIELNYKSNDLNFLFYLDSTPGYDGAWAWFRRKFIYSSSPEPELEFSYFQNIYSFKYKIEK